VIKLTVSTLGNSLDGADILAYTKRKKSEMFVVVQFESWMQTREIASGLIRWVFRGHGDVGYPLETTLYRGSRRLHCPPEILVEREAWVLRQFQRRAHQYIKDPPSVDERLEWLALIQHFGGPTRLLDFTHSFYVAAFFAIEQAEGDAAVWGVNLNRIERILARKLKLRQGGTTHDTNQAHIQYIHRFLGAKNGQPLVVNVEPERLNERISIQQGLFLFPCDLTCSFNANLAKTFAGISGELEEREAEQWSEMLEKQLSNDEIAVVMIILPRGIHREALDDLYKMNVTSATLFPDLTGFARSLYYYLRLMDVDKDDMDLYELFAGALRQHSRPKRRAEI